MGDFSRDPVVRLNDSAEKHYVGVRLQQGVPLLDADWNELEDLRKYEVAEMIRRFIGDGVPDGNDGFRIQALAGGATNTIVLRVVSSLIELTSIEVVLASSTAADRLGFLPGNTFSERFGNSPTQLTGNETEPFVLSDGLTFSVRINGGVEQIVTFSAADFIDITQATAAEVQVVLSTAIPTISVLIGIGNDFYISGGAGDIESAGRILVEGVETLNENTIAFQSQPLFQNTELANQWQVPEISPILDVVAERTDVIYIDVWEREIGYVEDEDIVDNAIGIETAVRLKREWAVRVSEGANDLSGIVRLTGHRYSVLVTVARNLTDVNQLNDNLITEQRNTQINVAKYLKTPIYFVSGVTTITADDFAVLLETLQTILLRRYREQVFDFTYSPVGIPHDENVVQQSLQAIIDFARFAAVQVRAGNFNNQDGLRTFADLYNLQIDFVSVVTDFGHFAAEATTQNFIDGFTSRLENATTGLGITTTNEDMLGAFEAQEEINSWLSLPIGELPEGSVIVTIIDVQPPVAVAFDVPFNITYQIESRVVSTRVQEDYLLSVDTSTASPWEFNLNANQLTLDSDGGIDTVVLTVTPRAGAASVIFELTAAATRNEPMVNMTHISPAFLIGLPPVAEDILQWISPALNQNGRIPFTQFMFQLGSGQTTVEIGINNTSDAGFTQRYQISFHVIPPVGEEAQWLPAPAAPAIQEIDVADGATETLIVAITGPNPPAIGTEGSVVLEATLLLENSAPPAVPSNVVLEIFFDVAS